MPTPLLTTKLTIPPVRPSLVERPRLLERLNEGLPRKLTLVSAPAGFGKTTLVSKWAAGCDWPIGWVSLDEQDNDPARFWAYAIAGLQRLQAGLGESALAALQAPNPPPIESALSSLINEAAAIPDRFILVLDDYHRIESKSIHDALAFLLEHLPPLGHLVLVTRSDPPLPLSRLRGRGHLNELRPADLRFTVDETTGFISQVMNIDLSAEQIAALEARTEGWIAGLQMAALSMQGRGSDEIANFIQDFAGRHRYILDYLTDEVLQQQSEQTQAFLLQTSILDRLYGPLCDAVLAKRRNLPADESFSSQAILEHLERSNLFVVPLDDERRWYRYHHLFADLLRQRLRRTRPDLLPALHLHASQWYAQNDLLADAVSHGLAAGDAAWVARLVGGNALAMMEHGELRTLERWLDTLSYSTAAAEPWLEIAHAWMAAFTGQLEEVEPLLQNVEGALAEPTAPGSAESAEIMGHVAAVQACVADLRGDRRQAAELAREALRRLPDNDVMTRGWAWVALALSLYGIGDIIAGDQALAEAVTISSAIGASHIAVLALCNQAVIQKQKGQLRAAADTFRRALQFSREYAERSGRPLPVSAYAHTHLAAVLCEWNDLEGALRHVRRGIELCERWGEPQLLTGGHMRLAAVLQAAGDEAGALEAINKAKRAASGLSAWYASRLEPFEAGIRLRQGDLATASRWAARQDMAPHNFYYLFEYLAACLTMVRVDMAHGRLAEALDRLEQVKAEAEAVGLGHYVIESIILQALARRALGELDEAMTGLETALYWAGPEGYMRTFLDEGAPMVALLQEAAARGIAPGFTDRLLAVLNQDTGAERQAPELPHESLVEPLSERELEVLRLVAAGLSNREIAEALYLSVNTVKSHTKSIYGKLDVHSRTQAASRARELGFV